MQADFIDYSTKDRETQLSAVKLFQKNSLKGPRENRTFKISHSAVLDRLGTWSVSVKAYTHQKQGLPGYKRSEWGEITDAFPNAECIIRAREVVIKIPNGSIKGDTAFVVVGVPTSGARKCKY